MKKISYHKSKVAIISKKGYGNFAQLIEEKLQRLEIEKVEIQQIALLPSKKN